MATILGCTVLEGTNKTGVLVPNADGYYTVCLGALELPNHAGLVYSRSSFERMLAANSPFMRRLKAGLCYGEFGHPKQEVGMSYDQWVRRLTVIEETKLCMHIADVWIDEQTIKHNGRFIIAIMGLVRPEGPYGSYLEQMLKNGRANVAFSVRSLTRDNYVRNVPTKHFDTLVGWDFVVEPGLPVATKYHLVNTPGLEAFDDIAIGTLTAETIEVNITAQALTRILQNQPGHVGLESSDALLREMIASLESRDHYAVVDPTMAPSAHW